MEKILKIIAGIIIALGCAMVIWFIIMCIMLALYDECQDLESGPMYCENYRNF